VKVVSRKGFTLVELLVVIAILALLMSILMPALRHVRSQAKVVLCQSNVKQWGSYFMMYTDDHDGSFQPGRGIAPWFYVLKPYYGDATELLCCPMANKGETSILVGGDATFATWGPQWFERWFKEIYGSYGINAWVTNVPAGTEFDYRPRYNWRTSHVKRAGYIPLMADAYWPEGWSEQTDSVPEFSGQVEYITFNDMQHFCLNRHDGYVGGLFMDYSARKIGLKELWKLMWHRNYPLDADPPVAWDEPRHWMCRFKDY